MSLFALAADESDEAGGPVAVADGAQVRVRGKQIVQDEAVPLPVYAVATLDMVSEAGVRRKVLQAGIMELMRED